MGCGNTEEGFVTLGMEEKDDLHLALINACKRAEFDNIILWGRSMGAVTIIHYLHMIHQSNADIKNNIEKSLKLKKSSEKLSGPELKAVNIKITELEIAIKKTESLNYADSRIKGIVLDSPFTSSNRVVRDLLKKNNGIPHIISMCALLPIKGTIKKNVGCDVLGSNKPKNLVHYIHKPALFLIGEFDELVNQKRFSQMFANYGDKRKILRHMKGTDHGDFRQDPDMLFSVDFASKMIEGAIAAQGKKDHFLHISTEAFTKMKSNPDVALHQNGNNNQQFNNNQGSKAHFYSNNQQKNGPIHQEQQFTHPYLMYSSKLISHPNEHGKR